MKALKNKDFAAGTITTSHPLATKLELLANAMWRLLHLRGFIDDKHHLTAWGEVLHAMLAALPSYMEESAPIAVELARSGLLTTERMFPYPGLPAGKSEDNKHILLIARIASLGRLDHKEIGYTGPLSRSYLGYQSMVNAVRSGLRDLAEVCLTTMLLNGDASRDREDFADLGLE